MTRKPIFIGIAGLCVLAGVLTAMWPGGCRLFGGCQAAPWTDDEIALLRSLSLESLPPIPAAPSNRVADNPQAAELGQRLFFDSRLSANGKVSCATCHQPQRHFTDGMPKAQAIGQSQRHTLSIVGSAYSPWLYWDGRKDSLWSQALSPLEDPAEHAGNRLMYVRLMADDPYYRQTYETIFEPLPDLADGSRFPANATPRHNDRWQAAWRNMDEADRQAINRAFANIGKAIAAYERRLVPGPGRFDAYVDAVLADDQGKQQSLFNQEEIKGLRLFIGEAQCIDCHNGPLLTNNEFHNTGVLTAPGDLPDRGRSDGLRQLQADSFNCMGPYSDQSADSCLELRFARTGESLLGAMRTPTLRNVAETAPYMHKGQIPTLAEVLEHYNEAPTAIVGHNEAKPLNLNGQELEQLEAFLHTLSSPLATEEQWLRPPSFTRENDEIDGPGGR